MSGQSQILRLLPVLLIAMITGCREDILPPDVFVGTKNSPVVDNYRSYYNMQIDADGLNMIFTDSLKFRTNNAYIEMLNFDHKSGSIYVTLFSGEDVLFRSLIDENRSSFNTSLEGRAPDKLMLSFNNFSGKFRIKLLPYN